MESNTASQHHSRSNSTSTTMTAGSSELIAFLRVLQLPFGDGTGTSTGGNVVTPVESELSVSDQQIQSLGKCT